jgi:hypothetical protein
MDYVNTNPISFTVPPFMGLAVRRPPPAFRDPEPSSANAGPPRFHVNCENRLVRIYKKRQQMTIQSVPSLVY